MAEDKSQSPEEAELRVAIEAVLSSRSRKKLVIAGPGTGKTTLFRELLKRAPGAPEHRVVLTFINNLKNDLEKDLGQLAKVFTLHSYCLGLLHRETRLRGSLSKDFPCVPGLASLIADDWEILERTTVPHFVGEMRSLSEQNHNSFYLRRGEYYDAVDFDDTVFRVHQGLISHGVVLESYDLVLVDEYQDFNALEAGIIDAIAGRSPIVIAGDDDQALYSQLRDASWDHIRLLSNAGEYEVFKLPFCMRCPKVIVDAVNDILTKAATSHRLRGRISKPFKHFPLLKGADSARYPKIILAETSVQRNEANYMGRFIVQAIAHIPADEIERAESDGYPSVLVIAAQPYRGQIVDHLQSCGLIEQPGREPDNVLNRETGLGILKTNPVSNLGWRVVLKFDDQSLLQVCVSATRNGDVRFVDVLPPQYCERILTEAAATGQIAATAPSVISPERRIGPSIKVTSFEGAKGLSAQHVFIAGMHNGEIPHDPTSIQDIEICKFIVGLTRTRKQCTLLCTRNFAGRKKIQSSFILWIAGSRLDFVKVDKQYWQ